MRGAGDRVPLDAILGEDAGFEERLHQVQDPFVSDPMSHPVHQAGVVDLVEARRDVALQHPLSSAGRDVRWWISAIASWARRFGRKP